MSNDKMRKIQEYFGPQYDSDEDLDEETKKKIKAKENVWDTTGAEKTRQEGWEKADTYPKIKRFVKGAWYGDKRKPKE
jgi:hypothetical protein